MTRLHARRVLLAALLAASGHALAAQHGNPRSETDVAPTPAELAPTPVADLAKSMPLVMTMDVAPGYRDRMFLEPSVDMEFSVKLLRSNPSARWKPTVYLSFGVKGASVRRFVNLSEDTALQKLYVRVRSVDVDAKTELENKIASGLFDLDHEFRVKAHFEENKLSIFVDGNLVDEQVLSGDPDQVELGASSGTFDIRMFAPPPPPSAE
jgi:hypothetical protein